jgi:hypothetical protein
MNGIKEYFSSKDSIEYLMRKIIDSGFTKTSVWPDSYSVNGCNYAFITMHQVTDKGIHPGEGMHMFYLELLKDPTKYPKDHPVFRLFKSLSDPKTLGTAKNEAKYSIDAYVKQ